MVANFVKTEITLDVLCKLHRVACGGACEQHGRVFVSLSSSLPGSPEYDIRRWGPRVLILSSSCFILTIDRAATASEAMMT